MKSIQSVWALPLVALLIPASAGAKTVRLDGNNFQSIVDKNPPGTTFIVSAGEHRMQRVVPRDGDVFIGELPALAFANTIRSNNITFRNAYGVSGVEGGIDNIITDPADVLAQLSTVTFDYDAYHVGNFDDQHWAWIDQNLNSPHVSFTDFQKIYKQELHGTVDKNLAPQFPAFITRHCQPLDGD